MVDGDELSRHLRGTARFTTEITGVLQSPTPNEQQVTCSKEYIYAIRNCKGKYTH